MVKRFPHLVFPFQVLGLLLASHSLLRLLFLFYHFSQTKGISTLGVLGGLALGVRFDFATLFLVDGVLFLFLALPGAWLRKKWPYLLSNIFFLASNALLLILNGIDVIYFGFSSKRMTHELFTSKGDLGNFELGDFLPFSWLIVLLLALFYLQFRWVGLWGKRQRARLEGIPRFGWVGWPVALVLGGLMFLGIRGLGTKPLRPSHAFASGNLFLGNLSLNTGYTVLTSLEMGMEKPIALMPDSEAIAATRALVRNDFDGDFLSEEFPLVRQAEFEGPENRYNVVLMMLESFNARFVGCIMGQNLDQSLTPNLDTLARHARWYSHFYSNSTRSVESLPAILNSRPDIFQRPTIGSTYETNAHWGLGNMLLARGYHTSFFCGGENGTMGFDAYSQISGFKHYYGRDQYPGETSGIMTKWGVHDLPFLTFMAGEQARFPEPFCSAWFSISNHYPYAPPSDLPAAIRDRQISDNQRTVMYTDYAIGQYFQQVKKQPWFGRTIFVITADHCQYDKANPSPNFVETFHTPLFIWAPGLEPGRDDRLGSQISILPTLMEILRLDGPHATQGVSLLSKTAKPFGISNMVGVLTLIQDSLAFSSNLEQVQPGFRWEKGEWIGDHAFEQTPRALEMDHLLKAYYQTLTNLRIQNRQFDPSLVR